MKRLFSFAIVLALLFSLCACSGSDSTSNQSADDNNSVGIQTDEGLFNVDVTVAKTFFEDMTEDEIKEAAEESGYSKCVINEDGSVTYTMTKSKHEEMLKEMKSDIDETIANLLEGESAVESFVSINYADDLSQFDIFVNDQYSDWDILYVFTFWISGAYYQSFAGVNTDDIDVIVNFIDNDTKETLYTASYKNYIDKESESTD